MRRGLVAGAAATLIACGPAADRARTIIVPSNVQWTSTPLRVIRGQRLRIEATGEVRLSFEVSDVATPGGAANGRLAVQAPIPSAPIGAIIGRVNSGRPFLIGGSREGVEVPADGRLFLGINDDHLADNSGNFVVRISES